MKLRHFMVADAVATDAQGKSFIHGGGIRQVNAISFPWTQPQLAVQVSLEREDEKYGSDHNLSIRLAGADGGPVVAEFESGFRIERGEDPELPELVNFALTLNGLVFPKPGIYTFVVTLDDEEIADQRLRVRGVEEAR